MEKGQKKKSFPPKSSEERASEKVGVIFTGEAEFAPESTEKTGEFSGGVVESVPPLLEGGESFAVKDGKVRSNGGGSAEKGGGRDRSERGEGEGYFGRNKRELWAEVAESTPSLIFVADRNGKIVAVNPAFCEITQFSEGEIIGKSGSFFLLDREVENICKKIAYSLEEKGQWAGELLVRKKNGGNSFMWFVARKIYSKRLNRHFYAALGIHLENPWEFRKQLEELLYYDPVTRLPNRQFFNLKVNRAIEKNTQEKKILGIIFFDIDRLNNFNQALGHKKGDLIIKELIRPVQANLRKEDLFCRWGGDEFAIMLDNPQNVESIEKIARRILNSISKPINVGKKQRVYITLSMGVAVFPQHGKTTEELLKNAEIAARKVKREGGGNVSFFESKLSLSAKEKVDRETQLRVAVARKQWILYYQPQLSLVRRQLIGLEALLRWRHPQKGLLSPSYFIEMAEELGIIGDIGQWVLEEAVRQLAKWKKSGIQIPKVAVNISPKQFQHCPLAEKIAHLTDRYQIDPKNLELEITESAIMKKSPHIQNQLQQLQKLGISMAIDDFGTGYSSLSYLRELPVDKIKIDQSFIRDILIDKNDEAIVEAIIAMAKALKISVVAEGIESEEQEKLLLKKGCRQGQGFLYAKPMTPEKLEEWMRDNGYLNNRTKR